MAVYFAVRNSSCSSSGANLLAISALDDELSTIEAAESLQRTEEGRGVRVTISTFLLKREGIVDAGEYLVKLEQGGFAIMCQAGTLWTQQLVPKGGTCLR